MSTLVLLRHGESVWNAEGIFTGWQDSDLSERGEKEAREAGLRLREEGYRPDVVHTSVLTRATRTATLALEAMELTWLPVRRHWRLNERHYGALETLDKKATADEHGVEQVQTWRRSYEVRPPALGPGDPRHPRNDARYRRLPPELLPSTECLKDVVLRMLPYWYDFIVPDLLGYGQVLVSAHGNSLRALIKHLKSISDDDIPSLEIPTGIPWVFELGDDLQPTADRFVGDPEEVEREAEAVRRQAMR